MRTGACGKDTDAATTRSVVGSQLSEQAIQDYSMLGVRYSWFVSANVSHIRPSGKPLVERSYSAGEMGCGQGGRGGFINKIGSTEAGAGVVITRSPVFCGLSPVLYGQA